MLDKIDKMIFEMVVLIFSLISSIYLYSMDPFNGMYGIYLVVYYALFWFTLFFIFFFLHYFSPRKNLPKDQVYRMRAQIMLNALGICSFTIFLASIR